MISDVLNSRVFLLPPLQHCSLRSRGSLYDGDSIQIVIYDWSTYLDSPRVRSIYALVSSFFLFYDYWSGFLKPLSDRISSWDRFRLSWEMSIFNLYQALQFNVSKSAGDCHKLTISFRRCWISVISYPHFLAPQMKIISRLNRLWCFN